MQVLGLAEIQLAEDFLSVGTLEWFPETWNYMKFTQFLIKSADFTAIWLNNFLSGEFHVFCGKTIIIGFGHCHGNLVVK